MTSWPTSTTSRRVVDVLPGELGDVHQTVDAAEVHERAEVDDRGDDAAAHLALLQGGEEVLPHLGLGLLQPRPAGQHDVVAVLVQLDDLGLELLADVRLEVAHPAHLDQGRRQEAAQPDVEDQAALDHLDDGAGDDAVLLLELLDRAPGALVLGALLGQDQPALLVLLLQDQGLDLVTDLDDLVGVDVVLDRELAGGDDTLGLVADVEQDLVTVHLDDDSLDDVAVVEVLDGQVDRGEEVLRGADVVHGYLRRRGRDGDGVGGASGHMSRDSDADRWSNGAQRARGSTCRDPVRKDWGDASSASLLGPRSRRPTTQRTVYVCAGGRVNRAPASRNGRVPAGQPVLVGRRGGRLPGRAWQLLGRRALRLGPRGSGRG